MWTLYHSVNCAVICKKKTHQKTNKNKHQKKNIWKNKIYSMAKVIPYNWVFFCRCQFLRFVQWICTCIYCDFIFWEYTSWLSDFHFLDEMKQLHDNLNQSALMWACAFILKLRSFSFPLNTPIPRSRNTCGSRMLTFSYEQRNDSSRWFTLVLIWPTSAWIGCIYHDIKQRWLNCDYSNWEMHTFEYSPCFYQRKQ